MGLVGTNGAGRYCVGTTALAPTQSKPVPMMLMGLVGTNGAGRYYVGTTVLAPTQSKPVPMMQWPGHRLMVLMGLVGTNGLVGTVLAPQHWLKPRVNQSQ